MSDATGTPHPASGGTAPAGWYADPSAPVRTEPPRSPGVDTNTVWIWLIVLTPLVTTVLLLFIPWNSLFRSAAVGTDPTQGLPYGLDVILSPAYLLLTLAAYVIAGANVLFAYLDRRELVARGIAQPFPWPWAFINPVYPIGRSVVSIRRTGRGAAPLWVLGFALLAAWTVAGVITWFAIDAAMDAFRDAVQYGTGGIG